jgi:hypothetical protein
VSADSSGPVDGTVVREFLARDPEVVVEQVVLKPFSVELHLVERDADGHAVRRTITRPIQWGA